MTSRKRSFGPTFVQQDDIEDVNAGRLQLSTLTDDHGTERKEVNENVQFPNTNTRDTSTRLCSTTSNSRKANKLLTAEEKEEKKVLKKKLKSLKKIQRLETRIRHAISRKDPVIEKEARIELEVLCAQTNCPSMMIDDEIAKRSNDDRDEDRDSKENCFAENFVLQISRKLFRSFATDIVGEGKSTTKSENDVDNGDRQHQTACAVKLLKNMTRGSVELSMFNNQAALIGYTRQKFFERSMLVYTSMWKLSPTNCDNNGGLGQEQRSIISKIWQKFQNDNIKSLCCIGCGPGNDCVGLLTFLHSLQNNDSMTTSTLQPISMERMIMIDWTIDKWDSVILTPLEAIMSEANIVERKEEDERTLEDTQIFNKSFCDVTKAYDDEINKCARILIDGSSCDIYLVSYLLSETNGKWESFFNGLVHSADLGSTFYFAEPTPWQLHRLIDLYSSFLDFIWIDSSMNEPSLQKLNGRLGPAVLAAVKS